MSEPIFGLLPIGPIPEPGLQRADDHVLRAQGVLLQQLRNKARFLKLIEIFVKPLQELELVFWSLIVDRRLDTAVGVQLDVIGKIVAEPRGGLGDTDYRAVLRVKGRVLRSKGTADDLIDICLLMLQGVAFTYQELYPASVLISTLAPPPFAANLLFKFLHKAKMAGVRLGVVTATDARSFTFASSASPIVDGSHGFADAVTPTSGGHFADLH